MAQNEQQERKEPIIINNTNEVLGFLEKALKLVKEYGITRILTVALLTALLSSFFYFIFNPEKAFEIYDRWEKTRHNQLIELRMENAPKIQSMLDKLTYKVGASRTMILEMHNGTEGMGGLPFTKFTATYESLNLGVHPVSHLYQEQNMSLIPFANFLFDKGYWCGNVDDIIEIDKALYYKMKSNNTEHFAACVIEGIDKPLAFLIVSFDTSPDELHNCKEVRENIRHIALETAVFLEVEQRLRK
jgi:hypothetical protein